MYRPSCKRSDTPCGSRSRSDGSPPQSPEERKRHVATRLMRPVILKNPTGPFAWTLLDKAVLLRLVGGSEVMYECPDQSAAPGSRRTWSWQTKRILAGRSASICGSGRSGGRDPAAIRPGREPQAARPARLTPTRLQPRDLQTTQHRRAMRHQAQTMARRGHPLRQGRHQLPGRAAPRRHLHPVGQETQKRRRVLSPRPPKRQPARKASRPQVPLSARATSQARLPLERFVHHTIQVR